MDVSQSLLDLLNFDPVLLGVFAALSMLYVQALKPFWRFANTYPQILNIIFTSFFALMIVFEVESVLKMLVLTYLMMIGASGIYNSAKNPDPGV